jgi:hypothetical protein
MVIKMIHFLYTIICNVGLVPGYQKLFLQNTIILVVISNEFNAIIKLMTK